MAACKFNDDKTTNDANCSRECEKYPSPASVRVQILIQINFVIRSQSVTSCIFTTWICLSRLICDADETNKSAGTGGGVDSARKRTSPIELAVFAIRSLSFQNPSRRESRRREYCLFFFFFVFSSCFFRCSAESDQRSNSVRTATRVFMKMILHVRVFANTRDLRGHVGGERGRSRRVSFTS